MFWLEMFSVGGIGCFNALMVVMIVSTKTIIKTEK